MLQRLESCGGRIGSAKAVVCVASALLLRSERTCARDIRSVVRTGFVLAHPRVTQVLGPPQFEPRGGSLRRRLRHFLC